MYDSRFRANQSKNFTIDDIEKQRFRVPGRSGKSKSLRNDPKRQLSAEELRHQGLSIVEKAARNTKMSLYSFASYLYKGYSQLKDIMAVDRDDSESNRRSRSRGRPRYPNSRSRDERN